MEGTVYKNAHEARVFKAAHSLWAAQPWRADAPVSDALTGDALGGLSPHCMILTVEHDPMDFTVAHIGGQIRSFMREDETGKRFRDSEGKGPGSSFWSYCELAVNSRRPILADTPYEGILWDLYDLRQLILPLASTGERVDHLVLAAVYSPREEVIPAHHAA